jgi:hypothetical protein
MRGKKKFFHTHGVREQELLSAVGVRRLDHNKAVVTRPHGALPIDDLVLLIRQIIM